MKDKVADIFSCAALYMMESEDESLHSSGLNNVLDLCVVLC